jgi:hypothetical protein
MTSDEQPTFDPAEIAEGRYCPIDEIELQLQADPTRFATAFQVLFRWYLDHFG